MMEDLRRSLFAKVDALLNEVFSNQDHPDDAHLQIAACIYQGQQHGDANDPEPRSTTVLDYININQWRKIDSLQNSESASSKPTLLTPVSGRAHRGNTLHSLRRQRCDQNEANFGDGSPSTCENQSQNASHKPTGGLRLGSGNGTRPMNTPPRTPTPPPTARQLEADDRQFPKRRKLDKDGPAKLEQTTVDKLVEGIWEQIHRPQSLALGSDLKNTFESIVQRLGNDDNAKLRQHVNFEDASKCCQQVTAGSRTNRALEVIVQAHWVDCYDGRIAHVRDTRTDLKTYEVRRLVMTEACSLFKWSEKELRNRMAIWKGYREIKNTAGWTALVFAGPGIYRFCKYRMGFDQEALSRLQSLRTRFEVAADTLQPQWRQLLSLVGQPTQLHWRGNPHDWVVSKKKDPIPLAFTYRQWDPDFRFEHLQEAVVDVEKWGDHDPRRSSHGPEYICAACSHRQSLAAELNECECFPDLYGPNPRATQPVQVFRTDNSRNNGLMACCTFARGTAVGEFVGLITKGLSNLDVMQSQVTNTDGSQNETYQIWQGRQGNYTRFINHSCQPNCQFQTFSWLGIQRILVISKGVPAGKEITVDYSGRYWQHLDKECLCGESKCRYSGNARTTGQTRSTNVR